MKIGCICWFAGFKGGELEKQLGKWKSSQKTLKMS